MEKYKYIVKPAHVNGMTAKRKAGLTNVTWCTRNKADYKITLKYKLSKKGKYLNMSFYYNDKVGVK